MPVAVEELPHLDLARRDAGEIEIRLGVEVAGEPGGQPRLDGIRLVAVQALQDPPQQRMADERNGVGDLVVVAEIDETLDP